MNGNDDAPVTRRELKAELAEFKAEFKAEISLDIASAMNHAVETLGASMRTEMTALRNDMATMRQDISREIVTMRQDISREMVEMRQELSRELAGHVRAAAEENRQFLAVLDDRYRDLPPRVSVLERDLDEHRRDTTLHPPRRRRK